MEYNQETDSYKAPKKYILFHAYIHGCQIEEMLVKRWAELDKFHYYITRLLHTT
jgi:hypothetical protein